ncbi:MAG: hypothetical protein IPL65_20400 [Lewinellaceae bacterium]|nr:hypothetical protein [Lewinellaceae bacterium]
MTCFNQLFYTLPLHIRDFVDTSDVLSGMTGLLRSLGMSGAADSLAGSMANNGQLNPEYMINFNAGAIIFFQVLVSYLVTRLKPFTTIFWGVPVSTVVSFSVLVF